MAKSKPCSLRGGWGSAGGIDNWFHVRLRDDLVFRSVAIVNADGKVEWIDKNALASANVKEAIAEIEAILVGYPIRQWKPTNGMFNSAWAIEPYHERRCP